MYSDFLAKTKPKEKQVDDLGDDRKKPGILLR